MNTIDNILRYLDDQTILTKEIHEIVVSPILKQHQNGKLSAFILIKNHIEFLIREEEKKEEEFERSHLFTGEWFDQILLGVN